MIKGKSIGELFPYALFSIILLGRFFFPFYINPVDHLFSDPGRHWENGQRLFNPTLIGSIDSKLYQLWLWFVQLISFDNRYVIAAATGVLCAGFLWCMYKFTREFMERKTALWCAIVIGLCPSLLTIYSVFMNETITLTMMALSLWLTFRAVRKNTFSAFVHMALCLVLFSLTRLIALPIILFCLGWFFGHVRKDWLKRSGIFVLILFFIYLPAGLHTYTGLNVFNPFGYQTMNRIYAESGYKNFGFSVETGAYYEFGSPSFHGVQPFYPFVDYMTARVSETYVFSVDTRKGDETWKEALNRVSLDPKETLLHVRDNIVYLLFGPTWPDTMALLWKYRFFTFPGISEYVWHYRWAWVPCLLFIVVSSCVLPVSKEQRFLLLLMWVLIFAMCVQMSGVMEGRYRKPVEPLILMNVIIFFAGWLRYVSGFLLNMRQACFLRRANRPCSEM